MKDHPSSKTDLSLKGALLIADSHAQIDDVLEYVALRVLASAVRAAQIHTADQCSAVETTAVIPAGFSTVIQCDGCGVHYVQGARHWSQCPTHPGEWVQVTPEEPTRELSPSEAASFPKTLARSPRRVEPSRPLPDHLKPPVKADDPCPAFDVTLHEEREGKCMYCGASMAPENGDGDGNL